MGRFYWSSRSGTSVRGRRPAALALLFELLEFLEKPSAITPPRDQSARLPPHFDEARRRIGGATCLHVAQSLFHDIAATRRLGIPSAWINRKGEPVPAFPTLAAFADWLAGTRSG